MRYADAVREVQISQNSPGRSRAWVMADDPSVATPFEPIQCPFFQHVPGGGVAKVDFAVGCNVQIVRQQKARVILQSKQCAVCLVRDLEDLTVWSNSIDLHSRHAHD